MSSSPVQWRLKAKLDRRFKSGHPWVYSNELQESPKGLEPGTPVLLSDAGGKFLAMGYGNPASLISFRALSRDEAERDAISRAGVLRRLIIASELRADLGLASTSHRLCHGEADRLPGLVIDRYVLSTGGQCLVLQAHTAGIDRILPEILEALEEAISQSKLWRGRSPVSWAQTAIVLRNDVGVRKLEGLSEEPPRIVRTLSGADLSLARIQVENATPGQPALEFDVDLLEGQKTGFFLDQAANIQLAVRRLSSFAQSRGLSRPLRVLDLCCYVGQWSAQLASLLKSQGIPAELTLVDASAKALELARRNVERQGVQVSTLKGDVLRELESIEAGTFDLIISDPPALIKGRKDVPVGTHAYLQLNTLVFRLLAEEGAVVSCSCSGLLEETAFLEVLSKAAYRNRRAIAWVARGGQAPDHPALAEFPEGRYLKCWVGIAERKAT